MNTKFFQLLEAQFGLNRNIKDEWVAAADNIDLLTEKDLRYFCRLAQIKKYSRMKRVQKIAALQPYFDKYKAEIEKEETAKLKSATKKQSKRKPLNIAPKTKEQVKPIKAGTKLHKAAMLIKKGATIAELMKLTGYTAKVARSTMFHENLTRRKGYGIKQEGEKFFLVFPKGINNLVVN